MFAGQLEEQEEF